MDLLATYPRAELFWADPDLVVDVVSSVLQLASRRRLRAFLQPDPFGRFVSVMVYLPRDRYTTDCRLAMQQILLDAFNGSGIRYTARVGDSLLAAVHFTVSTDPANPVRPDLTAADQGAARHHPHLGGPAGRGGRRRRRRGPGHRGRAVPVRRRVRRGLQGDLPGRGGGRRPAAAGPADRAGRSRAEDDPPSGTTRSATGGSSCTSPAARSPCPGPCRCCRRLGADVLDERPFEVRRSDGQPVPHLRFRADASRTRPVSDGRRRPELRARFSEAFIAAWAGRSRGRRVQPAGAGRRAELAGGGGAARLRALPAADRHPVHPAVRRAGAGRPPGELAADLARAVRRAVRPGPVRRAGRPATRPAEAEPDRGRRSPRRWTR